MKTILTSLLLGAVLATASALTPAEIAAINVNAASVGATARDGFTIAGTNVVVTRNGITEKVLKDIALPNGVRVAQDGTVILADGTRTTLRANQILTLDGLLQDTPITPAGVAPVPSGGTFPAGKKLEVGRGARDGVTVSGDEAFITRNGVTEKIASETRLKNGTMVRPDGTATLPNGSRITLRATQLMTLDGVLVEAPPRVK